MDKFFMLGMILDFIMLFILTIPQSTSVDGSHPFFMSLILVVYTVFLALKINFLNSSYWYSYILFLVMVGGVLILVLYLTAVSGNELFMLGFKFYYFYLLGLFVLLFFFMYLYKMFKLGGDYDSDDTKSVADLTNSLSFIKNLYLNMNISIYMLVYLFILMVIVVLICSKSSVPLRQMIN